MQIPFVQDNDRAALPFNLYPVQDQEFGYVLKQVPGLVKLAEVGRGPIREMIVAGKDLYVVSGKELYQVNSHYNATLIGTLEHPIGVAWMEFNALQVMVLDQNSGFIYDITDKSFQKITAEGFPLASSLTFIDNYFVVSVRDTERMQVSALLDGTTWDATVFGSSDGNPDDIVMVKAIHREVWAFNERTTEVFYDSGNADFPLERIQSAFMEVGCAAAKSVSIADNTLFWLTHEGHVVRANGYAPLNVSTRRVEREIAKCKNWSTAYSVSYVWEGHAWYGLTFPDDNLTLAYNIATNMWIRKGRFNFNCVGYSTYQWFNDTHVVGDALGNNLWAFADVNDLDGDILQRSFDSPCPRNKAKRIFYPSYELEFEAGLGTESGQGEDPKIMLTYSDNGGKTWSSERWLSIGKIGEYDRRGQIFRMGSGRDRIYRATITDPVKFTGRAVHIEMVPGT